MEFLTIIKRKSSYQDIINVLNDFEVIQNHIILSPEELCDKLYKKNSHLKKIIKKEKWCLICETKLPIYQINDIVTLGLDIGFVNIDEEFV